MGETPSAATAKYIRWRIRGWLVLLRARYLKSLVCEMSEGGQSLLSFGPNRLQRKPFTLDGIVGTCAVVGSERDVELAEVPVCDWEFARVVANVTEVGEEGVFRHVVTYL